MRWTTNTTTMRERSRRGLGPRDQEEQRTQRASFVVTYRTTRAHTAAAKAGIIVLDADAWLKKIPREAPRQVSSRPGWSKSTQAWMLESRAERSALVVSLRGARREQLL